MNHVYEHVINLYHTEYKFLKKAENHNLPF